MQTRKLIYISLLAVFMLTACGKPDTKDLAKSEQEVSQEQNKEASLDKGEDSQDSDGEASNTDKKTEDKSSTKTAEEDNNSSNATTTQKPTGGNTESNGSTTQNPATGSNTQKPSNGSTGSNGSTNTGGSTGSNTGGSNNSSNTGSNTGSTNTGSNTTKKPVKRVSEEVKSDVVPYKYGITKYDMTTNYYTVFSDDSKELLYSDSYTVYDTSNYSATDNQLKSEADSNSTKYMSYYQEVLRLVNEIRAEAGVGPLTLDTTLCKAASMRALEMDYSNQMSHTRPNGKDCFSVLDFYGASFGTCGENIAAGQTSASSVVKGWKNSPSHYQNMINASYTKLGVGYSAMGVGDYGHYWCQLFTN